MTWNYRYILHDKDEDKEKHWIGLHEVYYTDGVIDGWTENPVRFACDAWEGVEGLIESLQMALEDANEFKMLVESDLDKKEKA